MKRNRKLFFVFLLALGSSYGCGENAKYPGSPTLTLTGNWIISGQVIDPSRLDPNGNPAIMTIVSAAQLSQNGTAVSGMIEETFCFGAFSTFNVSGTLIDGQLTLAPTNPPPPSPLQFSVTANVSPDFKSFQGEVINFAGCTPVPSTFGVTGRPDSSAVGHWVGAIASAAGPVMNMRLNLNQAGTDASGVPALSGEVTISGSPCFASGTFTGNQIGRKLSGIIHTTNGDFQIPGFDGASLDPGNQLNFTYFIQGGSCNGDNGHGSLARE